jgi:hypothetical protein
VARSENPNDALACPTGLCAAKVDLITAPVPLSAAALAAKVAEILPAEPRTELVSGGTPAADGTVEYILVQRSAVFRFPDTVNVLVRPIDDGSGSGMPFLHRVFHRTIFEPPVMD